jgi:hypothetical protein
MAALCSRIDAIGQIRAYPTSAHFGSRTIQVMRLPSLVSRFSVSHPVRVGRIAGSARWGPCDMPCCPCRSDSREGCFSVNQLRRHKGFRRRQFPA